MIKASPVELRKMLEIVNAMKLAGIGFVPIPYTTEENKQELLKLMSENLEKTEKM